MRIGICYVVADRSLATTVLEKGAGERPRARLAIGPAHLWTLFGVLVRRLRPYGGPGRCRLLTDSTRDECVLLVPPRMVALLAVSGSMARRDEVVREWARESRDSGTLDERTASQALEQLSKLAALARLEGLDLLVRLMLPTAVPRTSSEAAAITR